MKSYLAWLGTMLLSTVAMFDAGCHSGCPPTPFCRWFDLATFCNDSSTCSVPPGMSIAPASLDGEKFSFGNGSFRDFWSPSSVAVPLSELADVLVQKPELDVVLRAGAPLSLDGIAITFDGQAAECQLIKGGDLENVIAFNCAVPAGAQELKFEYVVAGPRGSPGNAAFDVEMFLHERQGFCTGAEELCPL
jgi:hypothetical protein